MSSQPFLFVYKLPFTVVFTLINTVIIGVALAKNDGLTAQQKVSLVNYHLEKLKTELKNADIILLSYLFSTVIWVCICNL